MTDTMGTMDIAFPNLGIYLENVPQYIYIGDFGIAIYGIMIAIGMILGIIMAAHIAKKTGQDPDTYWDMSLWVIIFALIGARIFYVIFFWEAYADDLSQIFNLRAGGLAIYGGVIAGVLTAYVYSVIKKLYLPEILDTLVYGLLVGQIIGRWGNFFNREVFGEYTDNILAMRLPIEMVRERDITSELASHIADGTNYIQVHPTFLYESLWNLALLIFLLLFLKHRKFKGQMFLMYIAGYGIGRAWIEYIRTDQLYIPGTEIPVNMVIAIVLAIASIAAIIYICGKKKGEPAVGYGIAVKAKAEAAEAEAAEGETSEEMPEAEAAGEETAEGTGDPAAQEASSEEDTQGTGREEEAEPAGDDELPEQGKPDSTGDAAADVQKDASEAEDGVGSAPEDTAEPEGASGPQEHVVFAQGPDLVDPAAQEVQIFDEYEDSESSRLS